MVDTAQPDETDRGSHRAGSFQHRCLSWVRGTQVHYTWTRHCTATVSFGAADPHIHAACACICAVYYLPSDQHREVVMSWVCVALWIEVFLPSTETGQSGVCIVNNL